MTRPHNLILAGGGSSGVAAAIGAARAGGRALFLERLHELKEKGGRASICP